MSTILDLRDLWRDVSRVFNAAYGNYSDEEINQLLFDEKEPGLSKRGLNDCTPDLISAKT